MISVNAQVQNGQVAQHTQLPTTLARLALGNLTEDAQCQKQPFAILACCPCRLSNAPDECEQRE